MAKLTKPEAKMHAEAEAILGQSTETPLGRDDKVFIFEHWQESANHVNSAVGAFFTPFDYAMDVALEVGGGRVLDLCAGIGTLSYACTLRRSDVDITCVELNPAYVELGKRIIPEAEWVCANIFDLPDLGKFDYVISNPPFGNIKDAGDTPRYKGKEFQYKVIDIAADLGENGVFILPSQAAPFRYSGAPYFEWRPAQKYETFSKQTGIELDVGIGIDSTVYPQFHGTPVRTEVCVTDFDGVERGLFE